MYQSFSVMVVTFTFLFIIDLKSTIQLDKSKEKIKATLETNQLQYLDIFTTSRVTKL